MYLQHFGLQQEPFSIAPDPSLLYLSSAHREALAHLTYGFQHGGFVMITGEVGTGKTTLLRYLIKQTPANLEVAFILNPRLTVRELLQTMCDELGIAYDENNVDTVKQYIDLLNKHLLRTHQNGRSTVLIIDEAQNLSAAVLEQIRLLTNLETDERKLLRIILLGQPELGEMLARNELRQLAQRITARYHLSALSKDDSFAYLVHRLTRAGGHAQIFTKQAVNKLFRISKGIPRLLNVIADRAMLGAYVEGKHRVSASIVSKAAKEVMGSKPDYRLWIVGALLGLGSAGMAWAYFANANFSSGQIQRQQSEAPTPTLATNTVPKIAVETPAQKTPPAPTAPKLVISPGAAPAAEQENAAEQERTAEQKPVARKSAEPEAADHLPTPKMGEFESQRLAYSALFARWGQKYDAAENPLIPCDFAGSVNLQCARRRGSWEQINQLNMPVVLELSDSEGQNFFGAVVNKSPQGLFELAIGNERLWVSPLLLRDYWQGTFVVVWRTPPHYGGSLSNGDRHRSVEWLRNTMAEIMARPIPSDKRFEFDETLHETVMEFQTTEGLPVDGIVGPATWMKISDRLDLPRPMLGG